MKETTMKKITKKIININENKYTYKSHNVENGKLNIHFESMKKGGNNILTSFDMVDEYKSNNNIMKNIDYYMKGNMKNYMKNNVKNYMNGGMNDEDFIESDYTEIDIN